MKKKVLMMILLMSLTACKRKEVNYEEIPYNNTLVENQENLSFVNNEVGLENALVTVNPYGISPLTALISLNLDYASSLEVTVHGKDELTTLSYTISNGKSFDIPVVGLYLGENVVTIKTNKEEKDFIILVEDKDNPLIHKKVKVNAKEVDKLDNSFYFLSPSGLTRPCAYDVNGDLRWYLDIPSTWEFKINSDGLLTVSTDRLVNPMYYTSGFYLIDFLGKVYTEYTINGGYHHDLFEMANGNYLVCSNDFSTNTVEDVIVEINDKGEVLRTIDLKDILDPLTSKAISWVDYDWFHNNAVYYDKYHNLILLSGRHQDSIVALDYDTLELVYILGDPSTYSTEYQEYLLTPLEDLTWFYHQHAVKVIDEKHIALFDNGNYKSKTLDKAIDKDENYSRGIIYEIDLDKKTVKEAWSYGKERGATYYSPYISELDYLENDHYLVHSGGVVLKDGKPTNMPAGLAEFDELRSYTSEIKNDELIFELEVPDNYYRAEKIKVTDYISSTDISLEAKEYGSFMEEVYKNKKPGKEEKDNSVLETINLEVYQEKDRIVFKGNFSSGNIVRIYLENEDESRMYEWRISKKPYTSLCVNTFDNALLYKYISTTGLNGRYNIKLEINGKVYDLEKSVTVGGQND